MAVTDRIAFKNYISDLQDLEVKKFNVDNCSLNQVTLFKINQMIYTKDEFSLYKFSTVYNTLASLDVSIFLLIKSKGGNTDFYLGIRNHDKKSIAIKKEILRQALEGQFPGTQIDDSFIDIKNLMSDVGDGSLSIVTSLQSR